MRSKANFKGHPIHPALIPFPFAFLYGALLSDIGGTLFEEKSLWTTAIYLTIAGIAAALLAAIPGIIDYHHTVPPKSSAKQRATKHGITNLSAVALFGVALWLRPDGETAPTPIVLVLEVIGAALLGAGGWMGGTLAYRNQIGVDPRYAEAGKWKEERITGRPGERVVVAKADELKVDQMKLLHVGERRIVLGKTEEGYVAFDDRCTHKGGSLAGGAMICGKVQCPWHGSQFDTHTGAVHAGPAREAIATYQVDLSGNDVRLVIPKDETGS
jgi:uncharacterized membrane protein/nitrite reductase/ring-hydroxylating ferredoxin subunit